MRRTPRAGRALTEVPQPHYAVFALLQDDAVGAEIAHRVQPLASGGLERADVRAGGCPLPQVARLPNVLDLQRDRANQRVNEEWSSVTARVLLVDSLLRMLLILRQLNSPEMVEISPLSPTANKNRKYLVSIAKSAAEGYSGMPFNISTRPPPHAQ
jgi:hypothetical protein